MARVHAHARPSIFGPGRLNVGLWRALSARSDTLFMRDKVFHGIRARVHTHRIGSSATRRIKRRYFTSSSLELFSPLSIDGRTSFNSIFHSFMGQTEIRFCWGFLIRRSMNFPNKFIYKRSWLVNLKSLGSRIELSLVTFAKNRWSWNEFPRFLEDFFVYNSRVSLLERIVIGELENR